jgi:hypothetical protein
MVNDWFNGELERICNLGVVTHLRYYPSIWGWLVSRLSLGGD